MPRRSKIPIASLALLIACVSVPGIALATGPVDAAATESEISLPACPPASAVTALDPSQAEIHEGASVVFGSDVLGRVTFALDYNGDDFADEVMMYWEDTRRSNIKVRRLQSAKVMLLNGALTLQATDKSVAAIFGVRNRDLSTIRRVLLGYRQTVTAENGAGIARVGIHESSPGRLMSSYDHNSLYTWPEGFRKDAQFQQQTHGGGQCPNCPNANNYSCQGGGCNASSCNIPCSGACSVTCSSGSFACCNCPGGHPNGVCTPYCYGCSDIPP
jgi:hypothetical protein